MNQVALPTIKARFESWHWDQAERAVLYVSAYCDSQRKPPGSVYRKSTLKPLVARLALDFDCNRETVEVEESIFQRTIAYKNGVAKTEPLDNWTHLMPMMLLVEEPIWIRVLENNDWLRK